MCSALRFTYNKFRTADWKAITAYRLHLINPKWHRHIHWKLLITIALSKERTGLLNLRPVEIPACYYVWGPNQCQQLVYNSKCQMHWWTNKSNFILIHSPKYYLKLLKLKLLSSLKLFKIHCFFCFFLLITQCFQTIMFVIKIHFYP